MTRQILILSGVLALQIFLAAILMVTGKDTGAFASKETWIDLELSKLDKITIEEKEKPLLVLTKQGETWQMPNYFEFPVDQDKLEKVTGKLFGIHNSWPMATTEAAEKRFRVAEDSFERKIVFAKADYPVKTLFVGSSPSYRKVHARLNDEVEIYSINFSALETSSQPKDWADKSYLHVESEVISELVLPSVALKREGEQFIVAELKENEQANGSEIEKLINKITQLAFLEVLGTEDKPEYQQQSPELEIELVAKLEDRIKYTFSKLKDSEDYVLNKSTDDYYFKIANYVVDGLLAFSREKLVQEKPKIEVEENPEKRPESRQPATE